MPKIHRADLGPRHLWIGATWPQDTTKIARWIEITTKLGAGAMSVLGLRIFLGWDGSPIPEWIYESKTAQTERAVLSHQPKDFVELIQINDASDVRSGKREVRRVEVPVCDWSGILDARMFRLQLPLVAYEVWAAEHEHGRAMEAWLRLPKRERQSTGIPDALKGYIGSTIILIPQRRSFFCGTEDLVVIGGAKAAERLSLVAELLDGTAVLSRSVRKLHLEKRRHLTPQERLNYMQVRLVRGDFASINKALAEGAVEGLARHPPVRAGISASDFRLSLVDALSTDATIVGTIRGLGDGYFTNEPWREGAPSHGFSSPARVVHVPPGGAAGREALTRLRTAGSPLALCDPYAHPQLLGEAVSGGRVLVKTSNFPDAERQWSAEHGVSVRTLEGFHDRLVIGRRRAFLIGTSLQGLGKQDSFLVELDNQMRTIAKAAFEALWARAKPV